MSEFVCPLCGSTEICKEIMTGENGYTGYYCDYFRASFSLGDTIINSRDNDLKHKLLNLVTEYVLHKKYCRIQGVDLKWHFFYEPEYQMSENDKPQYINLSDLIKNYPDNVLDVANRALFNLSIKFPNYGDDICISTFDRRMIFEHNINNNSSYGIIKILIDLGYLKIINQKNQEYMISAEGWKKLMS